MRFCLLASGSRGNSIWVEEGSLAVAVDCGLSAREFRARAAARGLDPSKLAAILISHEHHDHVCGVGPLARALGLTVMANIATREALGGALGRVRWETFTTGDSLGLGPLTVRTVPLPHDAADPCGFVFEGAGGSLGLATDLGTATNLVRQRLAGQTSLILEFNHDYAMLMNGPYPWALKQRVHGRTGHLSNEDGAALAAGLCHGGLRRLVLAHLSQTNNTPLLAEAAARAALPPTVAVLAASQDDPSPVFES